MSGDWSSDVCSSDLIIYSYQKEPQYEREKIIYKDIVKSLSEAIQNKQSIQIKTKSDNIIRSVHLKEICTI